MINRKASRASRQALFGALALLWAAAVPAHPFRVEDMQNLSRLGEVRISPDGTWAVFTVTRSDLAKNRSATNLWKVRTAGSEPEQLTFVDHGSNDTPRWSADGRYLYFLSSRVDEKPQVFRLASHGETRQQMLQAVVQFLRAHNPTGLECDRVCCGIDLLTGLHMNAIARSIRRVASILVICLPLGFSAPVLHADESIKTDMRHAAHAIGDAAHEVGEDAKHALKEVVPTARKIGHTVARSAKEAGRAVAQGARETGTELKEAAHKGTKAAKREK